MHFIWIAVAIAVADATLWHSLPGLWRWVIVGALAYGLITMPLTLWRVLQTYWNASEAAHRNRELMSRTG
ncbi:MAG TPA: hypothetical protein VKR79_09830 [Gaiellaceae bacterium]|nr:hypothetical protein [Gaiellaceae bacterium]